MKSALLLLAIYCLSFFHARSWSLTPQSPEDWGLGLGIRSAKTPYKTKKKNISDVVPLLFYREANFEINGLEAKLTVYDHPNSRWKFHLLGKYRFIDIPQNYKKNFQGGSFDFGLEASQILNQRSKFRAQLLSDRKWKKYINLILESNYKFEKLTVEPYAWLQFKSSQFNQKYFGLIDQESENQFGLGLGYTFGAGVRLKYKLLSNLFLFSDLKVSAFDPKTRNSQFIDEPMIPEGYLGLIISQNQTQKRGALKSKHYLRTSFTFASPSDLKEIFSAKIRPDKYKNKMLSFSYGLPVADTLFGFDLPIYFTPMVVQHFKSDVQGSFNEYVLALKAYLPLQWPISWRLGFGEGLSYVERITYIENSELAKSGYQGNRLLNYLDFSIDFNLASLTGWNALTPLWIGLTTHHRSGIFESSSLFGRISGGSNYNGLSLYYDF